MLLAIDSQMLDRLDIEVAAMAENGAACQNSSIRKWATSKPRRGNLQMVFIKDRMVVISEEEDESSQAGESTPLPLSLVMERGLRVKLIKIKGGQ
jgi:hypothetical protein